MAAEYPDDDVLELQTEEPEPEPEEEPEDADEDDNLVFAMLRSKRGKEALKKISQDILAGIDEALENTEEYRDRKARDWKLFTGDLPAKSVPFVGCANSHIPLMLQNTLTIFSQMHAELFGDWSNVFQVVPMGEPHDAQARIMTVHDNWQIREQIPDFKRQLGHIGLLAFVVHGDMTVHSYYDDALNMNRHEVLTPDHFITPYTHTTTMPDYSDLPWYAKVIRRYRHQLEGMKGTWAEVDKVLEQGPPGWQDDPVAKGEEAIAETHGITIPDGSDEVDGAIEGTPWRLYHWEGWLKLPKQGRGRWCQVVIDRTSTNVLYLTIHEQENWQDKERFRLQMQEKEQYALTLAQYNDTIAQIQGQIQEFQAAATLASDLGDLGPEQKMASDQALADIAQEPMPPPPPPPVWMVGEDGTPDPMRDPEPPRMEPIRLFTHGVNIEPLVGNLGLGHGRILADQNRAANTSFNQFSDASILGNAKCIITTGNVEFDGGKFSVGPGKHLKAKRLSGSTLKDNILPLDFGPANGQLLEVVDRMHGYAREAAHAPGVLMGEPGKSGEPFKSQASRLEQATKILSVPTGKYRDVFEVVIKNNALLNSKHLPEEEIREIASAVGLPAERLVIRRDMYERSYNVVFRCDLKFKTDTQRVAEADQLTGLIQVNPILSQLAATWYYATRKQLEARQQYELIQLLPPPPPPNMPLAMYMAMLSGQVPGAPQPGQPQPGGSEPPPGAEGAPPPVARPPAAPMGAEQ